MPGEYSFTVKLPNAYSCLVGKYIQASKKDSKKTIDGHDSLDAKAVFYFDDQEVLLSFDRAGSFDFEIVSLDVVYDFANFKLDKNYIACIKDSIHYRVSISKVPRHIFHQQFTCTVSYRLDEFPGKYETKFYFNVPYFQSETTIKLEKAKAYLIPKEIETLFEKDQSKDKSALLRHIQSKGLDLIGRFRHALYVEDLTARQEMSTYKLLNVHLRFIKKCPDTSLTNFRFDVINKKILPANVLESSLRLIPMSKNFRDIEEMARANQGLACVEKFVDEDGKIWIEFSIYQKPGYDEILSTDLRYEVRFIPNNITFQACMKALESIDEKSLRGYFDDFDKIGWRTSKEKGRIYDEDEFEWHNKNIASNVEQMIAIRKIVNQSSFPLPYCIFGPPGTGKTSCLVECMLQIMKLKPKSKILVSAQSNSACNEIGERLLQYTSINNIFRLYSARLQFSNTAALSEKLLPSSNLRDSSSKFPTMEELQYFPVIITTVAAASQLDRALLHNHFDYIFIDECAATTEPEACIPIVELGFNDSTINASIILAGDPKQLPPVINSTVASDLGLNVSLMERAMSKALYRPSPRFDAQFITQLRDNFRSHPAILRFSNVEFYGSTLRAKNLSDEVNLGTKWKNLPNPKFPIIFHHEKSPSQFEKTSSYNEGEIRLVESYVDQLLAYGIGKKKIKPEDIGVISPYKAQSEKLKLVLPENVEVGTTENFQGREKLIIIISTVRSKTTVGFLGDPRRLNVCLTRAKALMIIVGNAETLQQDKLWHRFINFCVQNNACVGPDFFKKQMPRAYPNYDQLVEEFNNFVI